MKFFYFENVNSFTGGVNGFSIGTAETVEDFAGNYYASLEEEGDQLHVLRLYEITEEQYNAWPYCAPSDSQIVYDDYGLDDEDED